VAGYLIFIFYLFIAMGFLKLIKKWFIMLGINLDMIFASFRWLPSYIYDYFVFKKKYVWSSPISFFPVLSDKYLESWDYKTHYFIQDLRMAKKIYNANPIKQVDIGSRIDWFVWHLAVFREVEVLDIRPLSSEIPWVIFRQQDCTKIDGEYSEYTDSLSCLHTIEHIWLGRYWDPIDPDWHIKLIESFNILLKNWGKLYFSTPIGSPRIQFNAHRVFWVQEIFLLLSKYFTLHEFAYIDESFKLHENVDINKGFWSNFDLRYGCWLFVLEKIKNIR